MTDLVYLLLTVAAFAGLALLVGLIDRRLTDPDDAYDDAADPQTADDALEPAGSSR